MSKRPGTVVFDLGMVLLEWDPRHLYRQVFADADEMERFLAEVTHPAWNAEQDRGRPWEDAIAEATARAPHYANEIRLYRERWHEMQPHAIAGSVAILETLHAGGVPLYALTNWASDTFHETVPRYDFFKRFSGIIVSGDEKLIKPEPAIFHLLADRYGLDLADCVFIDDSAKNIAAAQALGMHALHFTSPEALADQLRLMGFEV
jgi:2-haloacid dehalogenase